ncbi:MAG TPA: hypothetical protein VFQ44_06530 [Streptosporangiaceae bacterium]|nr:hypothetical protein [Streptosporangiaceae bacterium]
MAAPPPVDHQLCYTASATGFKIPQGVILKNQFSPNGFAPVIGGLAIHCNPVQKTLPSGQKFPITNPDAHLACFTITAPISQPTPTVQVTNQFGSATLVPSQPNLLCLPSWKSLTGPPNMTPSQPPGLNHFTCYPVKVRSGSYAPPPVMLQDEFVSTAVSAQVSPTPNELCLPTEKIVSGADFPIINAVMHLLCFPVSPTPIRPQVWDQNQFGTSVVTIGRTTSLCLPSTKQIVTG